MEQALQPVLQHLWEQRSTFPTFAQFGNTKTVVDTTPIVIQRPSNPVHAKASYNGKFKRFVVKFQVLSDLFGRPLSVSGPHAGAGHDKGIWDRRAPDLDVGENVFGDCGYVGGRSIIHPFKRKRGQPDLTNEQKTMNKRISFFRVAIEQSIGQLKKFAIMSGKYRGRIFTAQGERMLRTIVNVITGLVGLQTLLSPLRRYPLGTLQLEPREYFLRLPIGQASEIYAPLSHPPPAIESDHDIRDFDVGDQVYVFIGERLWPGVVKKRKIQAGVYKIRLLFHDKTGEFLPRVCFHRPAV